MKKTVLLLAALLAFPITALGADISGAWKSTDVDNLTGTARTVVINKDSVSISGNPAQSEIEVEGNRFIVRRAGEKEPFLVIVVHNEGGKEWAQFTNHTFGTKTFVRTTIDDVNSILAARSQPEQDPLTSKKDPF